MHGLEGKDSKRVFHGTDVIIWGIYVDGVNGRSRVPLQKVLQVQSLTGGAVASHRRRHHLEGVARRLESNTSPAPPCPRHP